jgi:hypothetical protein
VPGCQTRLYDPLFDGPAVFGSHTAYFLTLSATAADRIRQLAEIASITDGPVKRLITVIVKITPSLPPYRVFPGILFCLNYNLPVPMGLVGLNNCTDNQRNIRYMAFDPGCITSIAWRA